jgi:peptide/nickel transport system ATP-binding protein
MDLMQVEKLRVSFGRRDGGRVTVVEDASFRIPERRIVGLVGESGCGKSVTAKSLLRIEAPARIDAGEILFRPPGGGEIAIHSLRQDGEAIRKVRWRRIAMIFQEPMTSMGPMHTIGNQIEEAIRLHLGEDRERARLSALNALHFTGIADPERVVRMYPHQMSGGMLQRAMIAMALSCRPDLLIADEPTTALDVSTESQILELLRNRQHAIGMSVLYITHNLSVMAHVADEVLVMYLGRIVERSDVARLFANPRHPYTRGLLHSMPRIDRDPVHRLEAIGGDVPDPNDRPRGCAFHPRCRDRIPNRCDRIRPEMALQDDGSSVACHLYAARAVA